jgi:peptide/nickel transport system permease protein
MISYIVRRLLQSAIIIILVSFGVFVAVRLLPGDPVYAIMSPGQAANLTREQIDKVRHESGLDKPIFEQYFIWVKDLAHGNLGKSVIYKTEVSQAIVERLPRTLHIGILALIIGVIVGIPIGIIAAVRRGSWLDTVVTSLANIGIAIPVFWLGVMLVNVLSLQFNLLPVMGYTSPFTDFGKSTKQLVMPVFCLAVWPIAGNARQIRTVMLEILRQDYIRTAWSKGLKERVVIFRHALRNCLIPTLTFIGLSIPTIVGGEVLIENVFNIPGLGRMIVESLVRQDYPYVQAGVLVISLAVVLSNLLIDICYGWIDPRIKFN